MKKILFWVCLGGVYGFAATAVDQANDAYGRGEFKKAIALYKKAAEGGENRAICYYNCANAYFQIDSVPQSIVYYKKSLSFAPEFFKTYLNLAISYYTVQDYGQAIAVMRRGLVFEPQNTKALLLLAASYHKLGSFAEAAVTFELITEISPQLEDPYPALGEIYTSLGDHQEAIKWMSYYPKSGKNYSYVCKLISEAYISLRDYSNAIYFLQNSLESEPNNRWTYFKIFDLQQKMGNELLALKTSQDVLTQFPDFGEIALVAGNLAFKLERLEQAEHLYQVAKANGSPGAVTGLENIRIKRLETAQKSREAADKDNVQ